MSTDDVKHIFQAWGLYVKHLMSSIWCHAYDVMHWKYDEYMSSTLCHPYDVNHFKHEDYMCDLLWSIYCEWFIVPPIWCAAIWCVSFNVTHMMRSVWKKVKIICQAFDVTHMASSISSMKILRQTLNIKHMMSSIWCLFFLLESITRELWYTQSN